MDDERRWPDEALRARTRLVRLAFRVIGDSGEAEDVVDESIARLVAEARAPSCTVAWLSRTVLRLAIDRRRHQDRRRRRSWVSDVERQRPPSRSPSDRVEAEELQSALWLAVDRLPARQREVLVLREIDGAPYRDIARVLEISEGAARAHAYAARDTLRKRLTGWLERPPIRNEEKR